MIRSIMFSIIEIRPDIFVKNLNYQHAKAVKTIFKYLKGSKSWKIIYREKEELKIEGYSDSN